MKQRKVRVMTKTKSDIQLTDMSNKEKDTKVKSSTKKTKKVETLEPKDETLDSVKVDVEIDLRNDLKQPCVYIRRKRSI